MTRQKSTKASPEMKQTLNVFLLLASAFLFLGGDTVQPAPGDQVPVPDQLEKLNERIADLNRKVENLELQNELLTDALVDQANTTEKELASLRNFIWAAMRPHPMFIQSGHDATASAPHDNDRLRRSTRNGIRGTPATAEQRLEPPAGAVISAGFTPVMGSMHWVEPPPAAVHL